MSAVVTCRVCGHSAPSDEMKVQRPFRIFAQGPAPSDDECWVCLDVGACFARFCELEQAESSDASVRSGT